MNWKETFRKSSHPWIEQTQFLPLSQSEVLSQAINNKAIFKSARNLSPAIVFDLDSTLFEVRYRTLRILQEFRDLREGSRLASKEFGDFWHWLVQVKASQLLYGIEASARAAGINFKAVRDSDDLHRLNSFWFERFFSSHYLLSDRPAPGAVQYLHKVKAQKIKLIYLTGRDSPGMGAGTFSALRHFGFPLSSDEELVLKPNFSMDDAEFKRDALRRISGKFQVMAFFDNEPRNLNVARETCPDAELIFCHTVCSTTEAVPLHGVGKINNFIQ